MRLIIDCMGGDRSPAEALAGAAEARAAWGGTYLLCGDRPRLEALGAERGLDLSGFEFLHTETVLGMEDEPMSFLREKADASMVLGLRALAEGRGDAFVGCGNTGALFAAASLIVRRLPGVHRAAIGTILPFAPPVLLLDSGANVTVRPEFLVQFAEMGTAYMRSLYGLERPRVALLNNGAEEGKGTPVHTEARALLAACPSIRFVGNAEASAVPFDVCDVLVTDGFTGNVYLKTVEGIGRLLMGRVAEMFRANPATKLAALSVRKRLRRFRRDFDASEHGGSPILGLRQPVFKAHGSSDARAFRNAIRAASVYAASDLTARLSGDPAGAEGADP